jgi:hypothetical protein
MIYQDSTLVRLPIKKAASHDVASIMCLTLDEGSAHEPYLDLMDHGEGSDITAAAPSTRRGPDRPIPSIYRNLDDRPLPQPGRLDAGYPYVFDGENESADEAGGVLRTSTRPTLNLLLHLYASI